MYSHSSFGMQKTALKNIRCIGWHHCDNLEHAHDAKIFLGILTNTSSKRRREVRNRIKYALRHKRFIIHLRQTKVGLFMHGDKVAVNISKDLYEKVKSKVSQSDEFNSVDEYVDFVLREIVSEEEKEQVSNEKDEKIIKERLKKLGYV